MKLTVQALMILAFAAMLEFFLPWWSVAIGSFVLGFLFATSGWRSFFAGFLGVGLLWLGVALYIDFATNSPLIDRMNQLLPTFDWRGLNFPSHFILTALIGGLVGGLSTMTGSILTYRKPYRW